MTYDVFGGMLDLVQSILSIVQGEGLLTVTGSHIHSAR